MVPDNFTLLLQDLYEHGQGVDQEVRRQDQGGGDSTTVSDVGSDACPQVAKTMHQFDTNKDGMLDYDEFVT